MLVAHQLRTNRAVDTVVRIARVVRIVFHVVLVLGGANVWSCGCCSCGCGCACVSPRDDSSIESMRMKLDRYLDRCICICVYVGIVLYVCMYYSNVQVYWGGS